MSVSRICHQQIVLENLTRSGLWMAVYCSDGFALMLTSPCHELEYRVQSKPNVGQFEWVINSFSNCKCAANSGEIILFSWAKIGIEYC